MKPAISFLSAVRPTIKYWYAPRSPIVDRTFTLAEVPAALRMLEEGRARRKIIITV